MHKPLSVFTTNQELSQLTLPDLLLQESGISITEESVQLPCLYWPDPQIPFFLFHRELLNTRYIERSKNYGGNKELEEIMFLSQVENSCS